MSSNNCIQVDSLKDSGAKLFVHVLPVGHHVDREAGFLEVAIGETVDLELGVESRCDALYDTRGR